MTMAYKYKTNFLKRCDYCHKPTHYLYKMVIGGITYNFCSGQHANLAEKNFKEKEKEGWKPGNPDEVTHIIEEGGENIETE